MRVSVMPVNVENDDRQALIWDILSNLEQDWQLLCTSKPSPVLIAYHVSR